VWSGTHLYTISSTSSSSTALSDKPSQLVLLLPSIPPRFLTSGSQGSSRTGAAELGGGSTVCGAAEELGGRATEEFVGEAGKCQHVGSLFHGD